MRATLQADPHEIDPKKRAAERLPASGADRAAPNPVLYMAIFVILSVLIRILLHKELDPNAYHRYPAHKEQDLEHALVGSAFLAEIKDQFHWWYRLHLGVLTSASGGGSQAINIGVNWNWKGAARRLHYLP